MVHRKDPASLNAMPGNGRVPRKPRRSASFTACFPTKKSIKQWEQEDLLQRIQRNSNRRCFTLPPISRTLHVDDVSDDISLPSASIATTREIDEQRLSRRTWNFPFLPHGGRRRTRTQAENRQSFLRAARSGNIGKITEYLNSNVDINTVSSVSI